MLGLRRIGEEPSECPFSGTPIPWTIGDIVCPQCGDSGFGFEPDDSCGRCGGGFGAVDFLYACEVPFELQVAP